jgi:hypothetical protein
MSLSSDLLRKSKHSDDAATSAASPQYWATPGPAKPSPAQTRDGKAAAEIAHSSTSQFQHIVTQDHARAHYGNIYVQSQYNSHNPGQQYSGDANQRTDFVEALAFDGMDSRYESIDPAHINTCQWLFQKPKHLQWRDPEHLTSHSGFLWIKGKAGSGKSTLMKCAFEHAEANFPHDAIISFFFNARGQHLAKSVEGMYRSLLSQILRHFPQLRPKFPTHSPVSVQQQGWAVPALRNHLYRAITSLGQGEAITLYIDALDECDEDDVREAIEHFEELGSAALSRSVALHICFASRYYPRVSIQHCIDIHLEEQFEHHQDIKKYINGKLAIRDVTLKAQIASEIEARASGVFFWVVLVVRLINKRCDKGAIHSEISKILQEVPDKIQEVIGTVLHSPDEALLCIMRWMLFALHPLMLEELYFAVRTGTGELTSGIWDTSEVNRDNMEAFILASSRGLVEMKTNGSITRAQLVHESVREYLITGGLKDLGPCSDKIVAADHHMRLFECCQTYLKFISEKHLLTVDGVNRRKSNDVRKTYPLLFYAGEYILHHLEASYTVGILHLDVLREFPLRQTIYLETYCSLDLYQQLLEPNRLFTSLLYVSMLRNCTRLAGALLAGNALHSSCFDNRGCTSAAASNSRLLATKIKVDFHFEGHMSSLTELAVKFFPGLMHILLDQRADVSIDGGAPFSTALDCGLGEDAGSIFLSHRALIRFVHKNSGMTVLALAVRRGKVATVTLLLEHCANEKGNHGTPAASPLLAALGHGILGGTNAERSQDIGGHRHVVHKDIVRALLDHKIDVLLGAGPKNISPFQLAVEHQRCNIVRPLTRYGQWYVDGADASLGPAARMMVEEVE